MWYQNNNYVYHIDFPWFPWNARWNGLIVCNNMYCTSISIIYNYMFYMLSIMLISSFDRLTFVFHKYGWLMLATNGQLVGDFKTTYVEPIATRLPPLSSRAAGPRSCWSKSFVRNMSKARVLFSLPRMEVNSHWFSAEKGPKGKHGWKSHALGPRIYRL